MPEDEEAAPPPAVPPCGACKLLRRRCVPHCIFAPYFPADGDMSRFAAVHRVFGACNTSKMLQAVELPEQRGLAADTLVEEARARARDPTFGLVSYIRILQEFNDNARRQVEEARAEIAREFGPALASEPVDVAAADPEVRVEARAQVAAALREAREIDDRLLALRNAKATEVRLRKLQPAVTLGGKGHDAKRHRTSETQKTRLAADAEQHGHHLAAPREETEPRPRFAEGYAHGQLDLHQRMSEWQQLSPAEEAAREEEAMAPAQMTEMGQRDAAAEATAWQHQDPAPPQLQEMQMEETSSMIGHDLAEKMGIMSQQQFAAAQQYHDPAPVHHGRFAYLVVPERSGNQDMMPWDAASGVTVEHDVMAMTQQSTAAAAWQHRDPVPQPEQMEDASTAELAKTLGIMSQQQRHDPAAVDYTSPWLQQQPATASQVASGPDMTMMMMQQQVATAELAPEMLPAGARRFGNLAAQYDGAELAMGYGHTDMHQQVAAAGKVARAPGMNTSHAAAAVEQEPVQFDMGAQRQWRILSQKQIEVYQKLAAEWKEQTAKKLVAVALAEDQETITQKAAAAHQRQYSETELGVSLGQGQPFRLLPMQSSTPFTQLAGVVELAGRPKTTSVQQVAPYANGELWSGDGAAMAFLSPGHAEAAPFAVGLQPHPQVQTTTALGLQMDSSLLPLSPSWGQQHAQVSHQQREDGPAFYSS